MNKENYKVYIHTNKINNKVYIGITKQSVNDRWGRNGVGYKNNAKAFYSAIEKYGWDNFYHDVLYEHLTKEEACEKEKYLIAKYNSTKATFGYNRHPGGTLNFQYIPCSEEKAEKIRKALKGKPFTEEHRQALCHPKSIKYACTPEKRLNIIKNKKDKKPIRCIETGVEYESVQDCARQLNLYPNNICKVLKGKLKHTGNLSFEYILKNS